SLFRPTEFGRSAAGVGSPFVGPRDQHPVAGGGVDSGTVSAEKRLLHPSILARVEAENGGPATGCEAIRQRPQKRLQRSELVVYLDPNRLENPPHRQVGLNLLHSRQTFAHRSAEGEGCGKI